MHSNEKKEKEKWFESINGKDASFIFQWQIKFVQHIQFEIALEEKFENNNDGSALVNFSSVANQICTIHKSENSFEEDVELQWL